MLRRLQLFVFAVIVLLLVPGRVFASQNPVNVYFFWGRGCPHCAKEKPFLEELKTKYNNLNIYEYEVWESSENRKILMKVGTALKKSFSGIPVTIIGDEVFVGFSPSTSSPQMIGRIDYCMENLCTDSVAQVVGLKDNLINTSVKGVPVGGDAPESIDVPVIGKLNIKNLALPFVSVILGAVDGFNPCAMWTLVFLISLLLGMQDKRRRWFLGILFIVTSALVYFLFMSAWLNLVIFLGFIVWVRLVISGVAIAGGIYNIREFRVNKDSVCKVSRGDKKKAIFERLKEVSSRKELVAAAVGIVFLAFAVNLVELVCSAGLPVVFTQILALSGVSPWQRYLYMALYIFVFMLDDILVFVTAMLTLEISGFNAKYSRYSHLIGGVVMLVVGILLIFKPGILMFG